MKSEEKESNDIPHIFPDVNIDVNDKKAIPLGSGTITSLLGKGGMANVYEIWNSHLEIYRAVKLIHPTCTEIEIERFDTEMKITAKLHHPYIVEIHGVGKWNSLSYIEMEKVDGITLKQLIDERGALPLSLCTAIGIMISQALQYAHEHEYVLYGKKYKGIIHRDIKPNNIMLCKNGTVKLMDFGIASPSDASFHTIDGTFVGTIQYLPPEQLKGKPLDERADIYSLATTIYESITGQRAFPEKNIAKLMAEKSKNQFRSLNDFDLKLPKELKKIITLCMHQNIENRIDSAKTLLQKLLKLHNKLTKKKPEEVVEDYLINNQYKKTEIQTRDRSVRNILSMAITVAVFSSFIYILFISISKMKEKKGIENKAKSTISIIDSSDKSETSLTLKDNSDQKTAIKYKQNNSINNGYDRKNLKSQKKPSIESKYTFIESIKDKYGSDNLMDIMEKALKAKNNNDVLKIFDKLTDSDKKSNKALVYKLRALKNLNNKNKLYKYLTNQNIKDAEFYLEKAKLAFDKNEIDRTEQYLGLAQKTPGLLLDNEAVKREIFYYKALCITKQFIADPSEHNYKNALGAWYRLKEFMKTDNQHYYFIKAVTEMQNIGQIFRNNEVKN
jgi:serine/threonine protein kinase